MSLKNLISSEDLAKLCFDRFNQLPKTGKPNSSEWTILAGVVLHNKRTGNCQVVSLGCGTKCIGKSKLCSQGLILNDSHAEVLARRGLIRYFYYEISKALANPNTPHNESIFKWMPEKQKFHLKDELTLHFLSTQTPCGDACILDANDENFTKEPAYKRQKMDGVAIEHTEDNIGSVVATVYTGAKLIGSHHTDPMEQLAGAVRTKPGRGERTLSMSCSDKLAKWQIMGVQGALLDNFLSEPIYFRTLNFCEDNSIEQLERAIWKRFKDQNYENNKYKLCIPEIRICNKPDFPYLQESTKQPSPNGLVWCNMPENLRYSLFIKPTVNYKIKNCFIFRPYEISVNGKKQGVTSKKLHTPSSALKISKYYLFKNFLEILSLKPDLLPKVHSMQNLTYFDAKFLNKDYQSAWFEVKEKYFKKWTQKPEHILKFYINDNANKEHT